MISGDGEGIEFFGNGSILKPLSVILAIVALIGGMAATVMPIQQQIDFIESHIKTVEERNEKSCNGIKQLIETERKLMMSIKEELDTFRNRNEDVHNKLLVSLEASKQKIEYLEKLVDEIRLIK